MEAGRPPSPGPVMGGAAPSRYPGMKKEGRVQDPPLPFNYRTYW